jgi:hypothetical protein
VVSNRLEFENKRRVGLPDVPRPGRGAYEFSDGLGMLMRYSSFRFDLITDAAFSENSEKSTTNMQSVLR